MCVSEKCGCVQLHPRVVLSNQKVAYHRKFFSRGSQERAHSAGALTRHVRRTELLYNQNFSFRLSQRACALFFRILGLFHPYEYSTHGQDSASIRVSHVHNVTNL